MHSQSAAALSFHFMLTRIRWQGSGKGVQATLQRACTFLLDTPITPHFHRHQIALPPPLSLYLVRLLTPDRASVTAPGSPLCSNCKSYFTSACRKPDETMIHSSVYDKLVNFVPV